MFSSLCSFPTTLLRLAVELVLLLISLLVVLPKHRRAGLLMAGAAGLDILVGIAIPLLELAGLGVMMNGVPTPHPNPNAGGPTDPAFGYAMAMFMITPLIPPLAQAFNLACFTAGVFMLARRLPDEERETNWNE